MDVINEDESIQILFKCSSFAAFVHRLFINLVLLLQCLISSLFLSLFLRLSDSICLRFVCIGQYSDDSHRSRRTPHLQQHEHHLYHQPHPHHHHSSSNGLASDDDDNESSTMFQANYEYTPLKDYAATKNGVRVTSETSSNGFQSKSTRGYPCSHSRQEDNR